MGKKKKEIETIAIYHRIYRRENFETAAKDLVGLIYAAQKQQPNVPRALFVDIDGHRNEAGGFDADMLELQKEFGIGFLLQFVQEIHFPLGSVRNSKGQRNDVPEKLIIGNEINERDSSLDELYIENYSNTEFLSEEDVYEFMRRVSAFFKAYQEMRFSQRGSNEFDLYGWLEMWHNHIDDLIIELFNSFVYGNLLSVSAMTRALMECYVYASILKKEESEALIHEWWLCNMIHKINAGGQPKNETLMPLIKGYCQRHNIDFEEKRKYYTETAKKDSGWLRELMKPNGVGFKSLCDYIDEAEIYEDYENASSFIHAQDITTKLSPFTFYSSIYSKLFLMMHYIFKTIRLFEVDEELELEMQGLEGKLRELGERYLE